MFQFDEDFMDNIIAVSNNGNDETGDNEDVGGLAVNLAAEHAEILSVMAVPSLDASPADLQKVCFEV
jgi:hypothetical protein